VLVPALLRTFEAARDHNVYYRFGRQTTEHRWTGLKQGQFNYFKLLPLSQICCVLSAKYNTIQKKNKKNIVSGLNYYIKWSITALKKFTI